MKKFLLPTSITFVLCAILLQCEAPRNNPLDPSNPNSPYVTLRGTIESLSLPRTNVSGARIIWGNGSEAVISDADGRFRMSNILPEDGWLIVEKEGFHADSSYIEWGGNKEFVQDMVLNARPALTSLRIYTVVINRPPFLREYNVTIEAAITDVDNDIDSVSWKVEDLDIKGVLKYDLDAERYAINFTPSQYNLGNEDIVGYPFDISVKDKDGNAVEIGKNQISRFISGEVMLSSPLITDPPVTEKPTLVWESFNPGYSHTYTVEVLRNLPEEIPELVWEKSGIPNTSKEVSVDTVLEPGSYIWAVWVVDEFRNRSRSKFGSFQVN
ncbi:MAG: hypothetical protein AAFP70_05915 [Calditrichota bacterium]